MNNHETLKQLKQFTDVEIHVYNAKTTENR